jgi:hypothetical protein
MRIIKQRLREMVVDLQVFLDVTAQWSNPAVHTGRMIVDCQGDDMRAPRVCAGRRLGRNR